MHLGLTVFLQNCLNSFSKSISISNLISLSFEDDVFPNALKLASVIPVFKKGDHLQCNKYSLTNFKHKN